MRSTAAVVLTAVLVLAASACGGSGDDGSLDPTTTRTLSIGGQAASVAAEPRSGPRQLLLVMHGYGGDRGVATRQPFIDLVRDGWIVASSDAHGDAWGDAASQEDYVALDGWVRSHFDVTDTVVVGVSMGAIAGLDLLAAHRLPGVSRWIGVSPVLDLAGAAAEDGDLQALVDASLRDPATVLARDPAALPPDALTGVDLSVVVTPDDRLVSPQADRRWALTQGARVVSCSGGHASADCYDQVSTLVAEAPSTGPPSPVSSTRPGSGRGSSS